MPTAPLFAAALAFVNIAASVLISRAIDENTSVSATLSLMMISLATQACLIYLALWLRSVPNRFVPTLSALLACDLVLTAIAGVGFLAFTDPTSLPYQLFSVGYLIWSLGVNGWILQHALDAPFFVGLLIALFISLFAFAMATQIALA